ncbi:hypothetical protein VHEMI05502 [[Torrubiella] hemipterigena]|uniref:Carboxylic ester hydrolase n=1 Tax=[Torrubiella] hemipterigena TaxID=1531966 RepID=A0A0A1TGW8_9HYPO|nr:hypothetical protein VHEMI05502 [[Torrubiella] hemipterigena]
MNLSSALTLCLAVVTAAGRDVNTTVIFPGGSVVGKSASGIETFAAIPYAEPPVGNLRLRLPRRLSAKLDHHDGTGTAPACPQMSTPEEAKRVMGKFLPPGYLSVLTGITGQEDCLTVTVQRPAGTTAADRLPVLFWIYGGGFEIGATSGYDASGLLTTAVSQNQSFVFVAVNYRVAGFGFLAGKQIAQDGSANIGLMDQRMGLQWVSDNIQAFGGDPSRVTIWGQSAGAISVFDQMALFGGNAKYKGRSLFQGAIMDSGSIIPTGPADGEQAQLVYDNVVRAAGCEGAPDSLRCLREVPYEKFYKAMDSQPNIFSYNSLALSYLPRPDGVILPDSPHVLAREGRYHAVPYIITDQEDEGTLFSPFQSNVTNTADLVQYLGDVFYSHAPKDALEELVCSYPDNPAAGSPFRTGQANEFYPGFKRMAAMLGDLAFTLMRRMTLEITSDVHPEVPSWSSLASYAYGVPNLGSSHLSDPAIFWGPPSNETLIANSRTYYLNFLHNQDPNDGVMLSSTWPRWSDCKELMWFESRNSTNLLSDDFRHESSQIIRKNLDVLTF